MNEKLHVIEGRLAVREVRMKELLNGLIKMDERFRAFILPPLPHEILLFIHTISDLLKELKSWMDEWVDYRKAISEVIKNNSGVDQCLESY